MQREIRVHRTTPAALFMMPCCVAFLTHAVYDDIHGITLLPMVGLSFVHQDGRLALVLAQIEVLVVTVQRELEFAVSARAGTRLVRSQ
jgi:hypothetical protein